MNRVYIEPLIYWKHMPTSFGFFSWKHRRFLSDSGGHSCSLDDSSIRFWNSLKKLHIFDEFWDLVFLENCLNKVRWFFSYANDQEIYVKVLIDNIRMEEWLWIYGKVIFFETLVTKRPNQSPTCQTYSQNDWSPSSI